MRTTQGLLDPCRMVPLMALSCVAASASAHTLQVAVYGSDSSVCGSPQAPCRSISQAIENAANGDTILVGPGRYGDVNGDGNYTGPGDEHPNPDAGHGDIAPPWGCIVCITKPLHIYSTQGAATTVVASDPQSTSLFHPSYASTVMIESPGVDFGSVGHGFTLTGGNQYGVMISLFFPVLENVSIAGNIDQGDVTGFSFMGFSDLLLCDAPGFDCRFPARVLIANNQAIGNGTGFDVEVNFSLAGSIIVKNNVAIGAGIGFLAEPGGSFQTDRGPAELSAGQVELQYNVASSGGVGFSTGTVGRMEHNTAVANAQAGFEVVPGGAPFYDNSAIGNGGPGVIVTLYDRNDFPYQFPEPISSPFMLFDGNNFINNDRNRPVLSLGPNGANPGPSAHCGVLIGIFLAGEPLQGPTLMQLSAQNNYWGSADGPSSSGPADAAGGACEQDGATTIVAPFSKTPFPIGSD